MIYRITVEIIPQDIYKLGFTEQYDPDEHQFLAPPRTVESRAKLLTMFGNVTVVDSSGEIVYAFPYLYEKGLKNE